MKNTWRWRLVTKKTSQGISRWKLWVPRHLPCRQGRGAGDWIQLTKCCCSLVTRSCPALSLLQPDDCSPQALLSTAFPRQECWSGLPSLSPGDFFDPGIELETSALAGGSFPTEPPGKCSVNDQWFNQSCLWNKAFIRNSKGQGSMSFQAAGPVEVYAGMPRERTWVPHVLPHALPCMFLLPGSSWVRAFYNKSVI